MGSTLFLAQAEWWPSSEEWCTGGPRGRGRFDICFRLWMLFRPPQMQQRELDEKWQSLPGRAFDEFFERNALAAGLARLPHAPASTFHQPSAAPIRVSFAFSPAAAAAIRRCAIDRRRPSSEPHRVLGRLQRPGHDPKPFGVEDLRRVNHANSRQLGYDAETLRKTAGSSLRLTPQEQAAIKPREATVKTPRERGSWLIACCAFCSASTCSGLRFSDIDCLSCAHSSLHNARRAQELHSAPPEGQFLPGRGCRQSAQLRN